MDRELFRVCMGRDPVDDEELAAAAERVGAFVDALKAGDPTAQALVDEVVKAFEMPAMTIAMMRPGAMPPRKRRTVIT
jgi:hypothetical protein